MKRGQVTVFILIGILIIGIMVGAGYFINSKAKEKSDLEFFSQTEIKLQTDNIQSNIFECTNQVTQAALNTIGLQGGYYNQPENTLNFENNFLPYYYNQGKITMPSKEEINNQLSDFLNKNLKSCLDDLNFPNFELIYKIPKTKTFIKEQEVLFEIDLPISIKHQDKILKLELNDYPVSQPSALSNILEVATFITNSHKTDSKTYCITCVAELAKQKQVYIQTTNLNDNSVLVIIGENKTSEQPYLFNFLNKYTGQEIKTNKFEFNQQSPLPPEKI